MHVILTSVGTDGDVYPFLGIGRAIRRRGHRVTLAVNEHLRAAALAADLEFVPLVSDAETAEFVGDPNLFHPVKGPWTISRWGVRFLDRQYRLLADLAADRNAVLVSSPGVLAARLAHERLGTPLVSVILQPWMILSSIAPPIMPAGLTLPRHMPAPLAALYWRLFDATGIALMGRPLNRLRRSVGLPPVRRVFRWWTSPERILGMFPAWYGPPQTDWSPQIRLCGFPIFDGSESAALPDDLLRFLRAETPPIAFTFGTGMMHGTRLFQIVADACIRLRIRAVLLTRHRAQLPANLPPDVFHCEFAPFRELFPKCAAVVHHGGIGTTARCLAAGVPQLVMPLAYDQLDNAVRVRRLGAGDFLKPRRATAARLADSVRHILDPKFAATLRDLKSRFDGLDGCERAADVIERSSANSRV